MNRVGKTVAIVKKLSILLFAVSLLLSYEKTVKAEDNPAAEEETFEAGELPAGEEANPEDGIYAGEEANPEDGIYEEEEVVPEDGIYADEEVVPEDGIFAEEEVIPEAGIYAEEEVIPEDGIYAEEEAFAEDELPADGEALAEYEIFADDEAGAGEDVIIEEETAGETDDNLYAANPTDGQCGEQVFWSYDAAGKTLAFTGEGDMYDYDWLAEPWHSYSRKAKELVISDGITSIGSNAFRGYTAEKVSIGKDVRRIGTDAFRQCTKIDELFLPASLTQIDAGAFTKMYDKNRSFVALHFLGDTPPEGLAAMTTDTTTYLFLPDTDAWRNAKDSLDDEMPRAVWCYDLPSVKCGEKAWWILNDNGTLVVNGEGAVTAPSLGVYADRVKEVKLREGITAVQTDAFHSCTALTDLEIYVIGAGEPECAGLKEAFTGCDSLQAITCMALNESGTAAQGKERHLLEDKETGELLLFAKGGGTKTYSSSAEHFDFAMVDGADKLERLYLGPDTKLENAAGYAGSKRLTVYAYAGSQAETMCELCGIPCESVFYHDAENTETQAGGVITVSASVKTCINVHDLTFAFGNTGADFGYDSGFYFSQDCYAAAYESPEVAALLRAVNYQHDGGRWQGSCFGMCAASVLKNHFLVETIKAGAAQADASVPYLICDTPAASASSAAVWYDGTAKSDPMVLRDVIERLQVGQYCSIVQNVYQLYKNHLDSILQLSARDGGLYREPFLVVFGTGTSAHVVTAYALVETGNDQSRLYVYDPNRPGAVRYLTIYSDQGTSTGWSYEMDADKTWSSEMNGGYISAAPAFAVVDMMNRMGQLTNDNAVAYLAGRCDLVITDTAGNVVATLQDGVFSSGDENVYAAITDTAEDGAPLTVFFLPAGGGYTVMNRSAEETTLSRIDPDGSVHSETPAMMQENGQDSAGEGTDESGQEGNGTGTSGGQDVGTGEQDTPENGNAGKSPDHEGGGRTDGSPENPAGGEGKPYLRVSAKKVRLQIGQSTKKLRVFMAAGDKIASVKSSRKKIVRVSGIKASKGRMRLTGKKAGTAVVTIRLKSGLSKTVKVKVQKKTVKTRRIDLTGLPKSNRAAVTETAETRLRIKKGTKLDVGARVVPFTSQQKLVCSSGSPKIASVSGKGVISARRTGKVRIELRSGKKKVTLKVTVY